MKKYISMLLVTILAIGCLSACASNEATYSSTTKDDKLKIVTTIFPEYDWVNEILGENAVNAEVTLLLDNQIDLHSYQPTAKDILTISNCDLFVYVGGESDDWVDDALAGVTNKNMVTLNLLEALGDSVKEEELVEGMQTDEEKPVQDEEEVEYDEHVWLSLRNAQVLCDAIADKLIIADNKNAEIYRTNAETYKEKLSALDEEYRSVIDSAEIKTLVFGDRFPFRYMVDDYRLGYYAAFSGCSAETEASFETISFLSQTVDELGLTHIMTLEGNNQKIAKTIIANTQAKNQNILSLDSMQSTTTKDIKNGASYLLIMQKNLDVLREALR